MLEGVTYTKESEAEEYAKRVGGTVVPVNQNGLDGFKVVVPQEPGKDEGVTSGPTEVHGRKEGSVEFEGASTRNMGGVVKDELGYMGGGVSYGDRGPIKYSKGGAVSGKNFRGSF